MEPFMLLDRHPTSLHLATMQRLIVAHTTSRSCCPNMNSLSAMARWLLPAIICTCTCVHVPHTLDTATI